MRFEQLIDQHHDEIYRYVYRLLGTAVQVDRAADAQDLTQEVFERAYKSYARLRPASNHRAWLYKIATNCTRTALKRQPPPLSEVADEVHAAPNPSPDLQLVLQETQAEVRAAIEALPFKQQAALIMRYLEECSYVEIAQALGCSEESARANVSQGLRRLRREFTGDNPHE